MSDTETTLFHRRLARRAAGVHRSMPVDVVSSGRVGNPLEAPPRVVGERWHYETKGGRRIHHPSAYSRHGWSNMVYVPSTRRVEVTREWLVVASIIETVASARK